MISLEKKAGNIYQEDYSTTLHSFRDKDATAGVLYLQSSVGTEEKKNATYLNTSICIPQQRFILPG